MLYDLIKNKDDKLSLNKTCDLLNVSKVGYLKNQGRKIDDEKVMVEKIESIVLEPPGRGYGYRRVTVELQKTISINHKKVLKLMNKHGLTRKKRKFRMNTTDSNHGFSICQNLVKNLEIIKLNQVWVADITYIRLLKEFVYLAGVMDIFSRKCIGWGLSRNIDTQLTLNALNKAFENRKNSDLTDLIHHSDQGVQYAANEYTELLEKNGIKISMSRRGNPYDNAFMESFMKTLKYEEVYLTEYLDFNDAYSNLGKFIEEVYNKKRLHSSIGYKTPDEYESMILNNIGA